MNIMHGNNIPLKWTQVAKEHHEPPLTKKTPCTLSGPSLMNMLSHCVSLLTPLNYFTIGIQLIDKINTQSTEKMPLIKY